MRQKVDKKAQGRIKGHSPVAVLDIGSNSIRMVIYERQTRALTPLYNEKSACALGQGVALTGLLNEDNMQKALKTMRRFALVIKLMQVENIYCVATSAVREAKNGKDFALKVEKITGVKVQILSGKQEAYYAALGAYAGIYKSSVSQVKIVGDLGGGSLELACLDNGNVSDEETFELGVIRLAENSGYDLILADKIVKEKIQPYLHNLAVAETFYAIGGSWRALAKLHQIFHNYPLHMILNYQVDANNMIEFCDEIIGEHKESGSYSGAELVSSSRRKLLPFGAVVLRNILIAGNFKKLIFSTLGVREGYLYSLLDDSEKNSDPLLQLCEEMSILRARSPKHSKELIEFTDSFYKAYEKNETDQQKRLRKAACLLADIGWRGHPDYRGEQSVNLVAYGALIGIDHADRAYLAQILMYRYMGLKRKYSSDDLLLLSKGDANSRARVIAGIFRVAFPLSAGMSGILEQVYFRVKNGVLQLILPKDLAFLDGNHLNNRLAQLAQASNFCSFEVLVDQ